jgi:hypothetical protein
MLLSRLLHHRVNHSDVVLVGCHHRRLRHIELLPSLVYHTLFQQYTVTLILVLTLISLKVFLLLSQQHFCHGSARIAWNWTRSELACLGLLEDCTVVGLRSRVSIGATAKCLIKLIAI